jgi:CBS domain-containing protein
MLKVQDLMTTAVMTLRETDLVSRADADMKLGNVRHLPVVNAKNHVVGMVSNRDVLRALGRANRNGGLAVSRIMSKQVWSVRPDVPAFAAARLMLDHKIGSLPVIDEDQQLVGVVTETDFVALAEQMLESTRSARESSVT